MDRMIVCFGEILLRLAAPGAEFLLQTPRFDAAVAGAEANVAVSLACLGTPSRMVSVLPDNALGRAARDELRRYGVETGAMSFSSIGRMGIYFLTPPAGLRAAEVLYDRADSAFVRADFTAIRWEEALHDATRLHVSGVTAALTQATAAATLKAVEAARALGLAVSLDCNHRAKLWAARGGDGPGDMKRLMSLAHCLFADRRDLAFALGQTFTDDRAAAKAAFAAFPDLELMAHTSRSQECADAAELSATLHARGGVEHRAPALRLSGIVDRIGAGDAFAAGLLHALDAGREPEAAIKFALAACALKHFTPGDFNLAREVDVDAVLNGEGMGVRR
ncbi:MAG: sugar kinase [Hyphomonadaceae bacterium]|nr:sugar kinase [Hyphomonadaceae bacterium]